MWFIGSQTSKQFTGEARKGAFALPFPEWKGFYKKHIKYMIATFVQASSDFNSIQLAANSQFGGDVKYIDYHSADGNIVTATTSPLTTLN